MNIKRQKYTEGSLVKIELPDNRIAFGRLLPNYGIAIYDLVLPKDASIPSIEHIASHPAFLYVTIFKDIITKSLFVIIASRKLSEQEINSIPPKFKQDLADYKDCVIYWNNGFEKKATPGECLGLERSAVWDADSLKQRILDHFERRKNAHAELQKVILSENDPRYLNPNVRWSPQEERWY